jgi:hypothetical protein
MLRRWSARGHFQQISPFFEEYLGALESPVGGLPVIWPVSGTRLLQGESNWKRARNR